MSLRAESVTFVDADGWEWEFHLTFMLSRYGCVWGHGCRSVKGDGSARGCCVHGVDVFIDEADRGNLENFKARVGELTDEDWQNRRLAVRSGPGGQELWRGATKQRFGPGNVHTRTHRGVCIFHNRADHAGGEGCALHQAAVARGEDPVDWKPETCSLVPLQLEDDDDARHTYVRAMSREDWGGSETDVAWWCVEQPAAYQAEQAVFVTMETELRRVCGDEVYDELAAYCRARLEQQAPVLLPMHEPVAVIELPIIS